ncbi:hypothetical protein E2C01_095860 [Portunus trituberculatus]|uniref:Uncharacterized protein n=1 Tax=Portunus trituberculatus TaxID=210409 RepID=A0A5B7JWG1_PORTR|nr:hypothetical protein [Portunus trituberculatus]
MSKLFVERKFEIIEIGGDVFWAGPQHTTWVRKNIIYTFGNILSHRCTTAFMMSYESLEVIGATYKFSHILAFMFTK